MSRVNGNSKSSSTTDTGQANAASIEAPHGRPQVSVGWNTTGAATITVEVSSDGTTWLDRTADVIQSQPGGAEKRAETFETGFTHVRAYADASLGELFLAAKGV